MLEWFICPDKEIIPVQDCLKCIIKCRYGRTCLTRPTRVKIAEERVWSGEPSTTQLLNGTMLEFLKLTNSYAIDPDSRMFALLGTRHHEMLHEMAKTLGLPSEVALTGDDKDIFDLLEQDEDGQWVLLDYKTWGSYRVAQAIGLVEIGKKPDPSGAVYKTSGKWGKAGSPKMVNVFQAMPQQVDNTEAELQLNRYRLLLKEKYGIDVVLMRIQATVRDGGLAVANSRGIDRNGIMIEIQMLPDERVKAYFDAKRTDLLLALAQGSWSIPCTNKESWDGVRCREYCDVWNFCPKGLLEHGGNQ